MLSIFTVKPVKTIPTGSVIHELDLILPRFDFTDFYIGWKDDKNQNSVFLFKEENRENVSKMLFRFDLESDYSTFMQHVIDFVTRNGFELTVEQTITFPVSKLNKELIDTNVNRFQTVEKPTEFLQSQKVHFRQLINPNQASAENSPDYWRTFQDLIAILESGKKHLVINEFLGATKLIDGSKSSWTEFVKKFDEITTRNIGSLSESEYEKTVWVKYWIEDAIKNA